MAERGTRARSLSVGTALFAACLSFAAGLAAARAVPDAEAARRRSQQPAAAPKDADSQCENCPGEGDFAELSRFASVLSHIQNSHLSPPSTQRLIDGAIRGMVSSLDPHSAYLSESDAAEMAAESRQGHRASPGLSLAAVSIDRARIAELSDNTQGKQGTGGGIRGTLRMMAVVAPEDGSPGARAGILPGDLVTHIDGQPTGGMDVERAEALLRGEEGTRVSLGILRPGFRAPRRIDLVRELPGESSAEVSELTDVPGGSGIALIRIKRFSEGTALAVKSGLAALRRAAAAPASKSASASAPPLRGIILDLRNNPGGRLDEAVRVAELFLPGSRVVYRLSGKGGQLLESPKTHAAGPKIDLPLTVLVNGGTASAAEILAGALQDEGRGRLIGEKTFGKGSVQLAFALSGGGALKLTVGRCSTPKGREIHGTGLVPDVEAAPSFREAQHQSETPRTLDFQGKIGDTNAPFVPVGSGRAAVPDPAMTAALRVIASEAAKDTSPH